MNEITDNKKTRLASFFKGFHLVIFLCVMVLRATYNDNPQTTTMNAGQFFTDQGISLMISSALIFSSLLWFIFSLRKPTLSWRSSSMGIGLLIFLAAAIIGFYVASDKRAALTDLLTLASPIIGAMVLVQLLDSPQKIRIMLMVLLALSFVGVYQCFNQHRDSNDSLIKFYEEDQQAHLETIGIATGSFEHMLYEHRLYSKDIHGFMTTSNSAGSFFILALFAAIALAADKLGSAESKTKLSLLLSIVAVLLASAGLLMTMSKGAIGAAALAFTLFLIAALFGKKLWHYRKPILILGILAIIAGTFAIAMHGKKHNSLPGGNSMLVRWQYWQSAAKMYADKPVTGVGGGNFGSYYTHYKLPEALETVRDPHNFILSILSQYGPIGLLGFLMAFAIPMLTTAMKKSTRDIQPAPKEQFDKLAKLALLSGFAAMLLIRPFVMADELGNQLVVKVYVSMLLYIIPACLFLLGFYALLRIEKLSPNFKCSRLSSAAILCGIVGVLVANLIDFAIFEPSISTPLWAMVATLVAMASLSGKTKTLSFPIGAKFKTLAALAAVSCAVMVMAIVIPPIISGIYQQKAMQDMASAYSTLQRAGYYDRLNAKPMSLCGSLLVQGYNRVPGQKSKLLYQAADFYRAAIGRNSASYKNYDKLSEIYELISTKVSAQEQPELLQKAITAAMAAVERYPGSARLSMHAARLYEQTGKTQQAITHYQKAIDIEDRYQQMYKKMYPGKKMFSRLGQDEYNHAAKKIKELTP